MTEPNASVVPANATPVTPAESHTTVTPTESHTHCDTNRRPHPLLRPR